ncbi:MAG: hypothetical protein IJG00_04890 [Clostridia bacterium]|nr:hypothetical protein [Clostridia bacterium]
MDIKNLYEKNFSSLNKTVFYNLVKTKSEGKDSFGIQIVTKLRNYEEKEIINDISRKEDFVKKIINYLYENAVDTTHFKDVVEDYILKMEGI